MADQEYHNYVVIAISTGQISGLLYDGKVSFFYAKENTCYSYFIIVGLSS